MTHRKIAILIVVWGLIIPCVALGGVNGYELLKKIRSPQELLFPAFPSKYCAPVTLLGPIAEEMKKTIQDLGYDAPSYNEFFDGKTFTLFLANSAYPVQTRNLLSGIVNPPEMIDMIVSSVVKYKNKQQFAALVNETNCSIQWILQDKKSLARINITPRGNRFAYNYQDFGAFIQETWLTSLTIDLDTASKVVYQIDINKCNKRIDATGTEAPKIDTTAALYRFSYDFNKKIVLPKKLDLTVNGNLSMSIEAMYKNYKGHYVFEKKVICIMSGPEQQSCLTMNYGDYNNEQCRFSKDLTRDPNSYGKRLSKAAELSKKATDELRLGNITTSVRVLKTLVEKYPGTPQAIEAQRLLARVPSNLQ